ncbi:MAG: hypothetical protein JWP02_3116, partial [Acidimicrobiales bacterium]|nr:hypothetical protein [Acidimicrobiales bacterium]
MRGLRSTAGSIRRAVAARVDPSRATGHSPGLFRIVSDYPLDPEPRYGYGKPPHPELYEMIAKGRDGYAALLRQFLEFKTDLARIPLDVQSPSDPYWHNGSFQGLDAVALYSLLALNNPPRLIEVGSGNSTKFARRAIRDHGLRTTITSIDPEPRAEVDDLCDQTIRGQLE